MQHFGSLTAEEKQLFLSVISPNNIVPVDKPKKRTKKQLPFEFSEEAFYQKLASSHNEKVIKRLEKYKGSKNRK